MHRKLEKVYYEIRRPRTTWDDIGGCAEAKAALRQMVCLPLMRPADVARMGLVPPAAILLWGPLGTGLAMLPEACASEAGVGYVYVSGREILGKPEALVETLREAEREAPAVLYISDLDWLAPQPGANYAWGPEGNERGKPPTFADREMTDTFLRELDRLQAATAGRLAIIGGTYRIDVVDQALDQGQEPLQPQGLPAAAGPARAAGRCSGSTRRASRTTGASTWTRSRR